MVESVLILTDKAPFGTNSAMEAIRMGAGVMGLGPGVACKILFHGDAVLFASKKLNAAAIGVDTAAEAIELAELTEMPIMLVKEDMDARGLKSEDLMEYPNLIVINRADIVNIIQEHATAFRL